MTNKMYVVTQAGREVWERQDAAVPEEYRRLLWLIDVQGDARAINGLLRDYSAQLLRDWLTELEELRFIEVRPRGPDADTTIPLTENTPAVEAGRDAAASLSGTGAYLAVHRSDKRRRAKPPAESTVLIVEDDADQLALADLRVSMVGYNVRVASSVGELVKSLLKDGAPDLLLLDVLLPDGNGFDVLAKIRRHPAFASLPVVLLTAVRDPEHIAKGLAFGADGYVTKPYSKNLLARVIHDVLS